MSWYGTVNETEKGIKPSNSIWFDSNVLNGLRGFTAIHICVFHVLTHSTLGVVTYAQVRQIWQREISSFHKGCFNIWDCIRCTCPFSSCFLDSPALLAMEGRSTKDQHSVVDPAGQ